MNLRSVVYIRKGGLDRPYYLTLHFGQITFSADFNDALLFNRPQDAHLFKNELMSEDDQVDSLVEDSD